MLGVDIDEMDSRGVYLEVRASWVTPSFKTRLIILSSISVKLQTCSTSKPRNKSLRETEDKL